MTDKKKPRDEIKKRIDPETAKSGKVLDASLPESERKQPAKVGKDDGFLVTTSGNLSTTSANNVAQIILREHRFDGAFRLNEFTGDVDVLKDVKLPLPKLGTSVTIKKGEYNDQVISNVGMFIENNPAYEVTFKAPVIDDGISTVAQINAYNPVKDYFMNAYKHWDKKHRFDTIFHTYLGADVNEINSLISQIFFTAVAAKALRPETKVDYVLDLVGGQGVGKTTFFQKIAPLDLYTDQFNTFTDKDDFAVMKGKLIINDDEMTATHNSSFEVIKKFITMQQFEYRRPYARKPESFDKKFVMVRTTNELRYLKDKSGDRRFLTIFCDPAKQEKSPVTDLSTELVEQLWGEAVWSFKTFPDIFNLSNKQKDALEANREQFKWSSGLEDDIKDLLDGKFKDWSFISNHEMALALFDNPKALSGTDKRVKDVRYLMSNLGYDPGRLGRDHEGKTGRGFKKM